MRLRETILISINGPDQPGVTTAAMGVLANAGATVQNLEQMVVRNKLTLEIVAELPRGNDALKDMLLLGWQRGLDVDFELTDGYVGARSTPSLIVTVVGKSLDPSDLETVTSAIAKANGNIERIQRLSNSPVWSYEFEVHGGRIDEMRPLLMDTATDNPQFDVAVQRAGLSRRAQRLVILDVDSTLIQNEMIDLLADQAGCGDQCAAITESAMSGEIDFETSLRSRVSLLAGQPIEILDRAFEQLDLTQGADTFVTTLHRLGFKVAIVSGGFVSFTDRLQAQLGLEYAFANQLEHRGGVLTGDLVGRIIDREAKADVLRELADREGISTDQIVAVGDGANDLDMLAAAGLGIAFCAKPVVRQAADAALSAPHLDAVLFLLGVRREELVDDGLATSDPKISS